MSKKTPLTTHDSRLAPDAVLLFAARAQAVDPDFALSEENAPLVAEICRRLDGVPLAIELAAARTNLLRLPALLERLERRLPLLTGGPRNAPQRLRSMHDAISWSHDLLDQETQVLFRHLAVFADGCTLDAAEAVAGGQSYRFEGDSPDGLRGRGGEGRTTNASAFRLPLSPSKR